MFEKLARRLTRRRLGDEGERLAIAYLKGLGYRVVATNLRVPLGRSTSGRAVIGEVDVVAYDGATLAFVEVKTRRASGSGRGPWEALHERKRAQVRRMAAAYLADVQDRPRATELRFDAIGVVIDPRGRLVRLDHLEAAF